MSLTLRSSIYGFCSLVLFTGLSACVPPPPVEPAPLVVWPGQNKPYAIFQQDDANCRASVAPPSNSSNTISGNGAAAIAPTDPNVAYTQCMVAHGNIAAPAPTEPPGVAYGYPYPAYYASPVVYGGPVFYGTWGGGWGGGYRRWR